MSVSSSRIPLLGAAALALLLPVVVSAAPGSLESFRLPQGEVPPDPAQQGPVAPDVPESRLPPAATPTPSPTPTPRATTAPPPVIRLPAPSPTPAPQVRPTARPSPQAAAPVPTSPAPAGQDPALAEPLPEETGPAAAPPSTLPPAAFEPAPASGTGSGTGRGISAAAVVLGGFGLLLLAAMALWLWKRRDRSPRKLVVPQVERPRPPAPPAAPAPPPVAPAAPSPAPAPAPSTASADNGLAVDLIARSLSMTLVNAALGWRLALHNQTSAALDGVEVTLDMISAHKDLADAERMAGPAAQADRHTVGSIAAGEARVVQGDVRLPFPKIVPMWQGELALLMPLVRLRVTAPGMAPIDRVVLVGQPSPRNPATLQPFRLDLGPRTYPEIGSRVIG